MIEWNDSLSVGVTVIDDDHKTLIDLLNRYLQALETKKTLVVEEVFRELEHYTHYHFAREEELMAQCGYEQLDDHKHRHEVLCDSLRDYYNDVLWGADAEQEAEIIAFLNSWLTEHIMGEDFQYRECMAKLNLG